MHSQQRRFGQKVLHRGVDVRVPRMSEKRDNVSLLQDLHTANIAMHVAHIKKEAGDPLAHSRLIQAQERNQ